MIKLSMEENSNLKNWFNRIMQVLIAGSNGYVPDMLAGLAVAVRRIHRSIVETINKDTADNLIHIFVGQVVESCDATSYTPKN